MSHSHFVRKAVGVDCLFGSLSPEEKDESQAQMSLRYFVVTGTAAHSRIVKLLPVDWQDVTNKTNSLNESLDFLWENRPRRETKHLRDLVKCYSHLPNGIALLDDKGNVARLLSDTVSATDSAFALLPTLVFYFDDFQTVFQDQEDYRIPVSLTSEPSCCSCCGRKDPSWTEPLCRTCEYFTRNVWVVKDVSSNGASGIWFVDSRGHNKLPPLIQSRPSHSKQEKFVAQRYAWPLLLFQGRKFHVRIYVVFTCYGQAFVHKRAFLHVANELFQVDVAMVRSQSFEPSMHITNCCANSHDAQKFMGEICADLTQFSSSPSDTVISPLFAPFYDTTQYNHVPITPETIIPLGEFMPSISASIKTLAQQSFFFLQGGIPNHGFEYLGLDFILSYRPDPSSSSSKLSPLAYLLEVNAPPSQDTATGLPHAEALHDQVLKEWIDFWVLPHVLGNFSPKQNSGGWLQVYTESDESENVKLSPSKAAWVNKVRWILYENKLARQARFRRKDHSKVVSDQSIITHFRRKAFPYFRSCNHVVSTTTVTGTSPYIYFENAGGTQVPHSVINCMKESLSYRHRELVGLEQKNNAKTILSWFLRAPQSTHDIFLGPNTSSMLDKLSFYMVENKWIGDRDEIIIATENHRANVDPWVRLEHLGVVIRWWRTYTRLDDSNDIGTSLLYLLTPRTRLVCLSHASNILGSVRNIGKICSIIRDYEKQNGCRIQIVVDGVGVIPHLYPHVARDGADFYVVSLHKIFGPTIGVLCVKKAALELLCPANDYTFTCYLEKGTANYEACAGIQGLWKYFSRLAVLHSSIVGDKPLEKELWDESDEPLIPDNISNAADVLEMAYDCIYRIENKLFRFLMDQLIKEPNLILVRDSIEESSVCLIPLVCFVHKTLDHADIVQYCLKHGVILRASTFLATELFLQDYGIADKKYGVVRVSLCHYNTLSEVEQLIRVLKSMDDW